MKTKNVITPTNAILSLPRLLSHLQLLRLAKKETGTLEVVVVTPSVVTATTSRPTQFSLLACLIAARHLEQRATMRMSVPHHLHHILPQLRPLLEVPPLFPRRPLVHRPWLRVEETKSFILRRDYTQESSYIR